jgi:hypothetical protein
MSIYLPSLLDKFKDFVNGLKANWQDYETHVDNTTDAHGIDVIAEDLADHVAETAEDDVHGLLSGGFIIEDFGSNDDGSWVRFSNGLQVCWGSNTFPGEGWTGSGDKWYLTGQSLTFPITFDSAPTFLGTTQDPSIAARSAKLASFNVGTSAVTAVSFNGWGTTSASFYLHWLAIGWWK